MKSHAVYFFLGLVLGSLTLGCASTETPQPVVKAPPPLVIRQKDKELLPPILFAPNQAALSPEAATLLDKLAAYLKEHPEITRIRVAGFSGSPRDDMMQDEGISVRRAYTVKWALVDRGIAAERLEATGLSDDEPIGSPDTPAGRDEDRRVEFHILKQTPPPDSKE